MIYESIFSDIWGIMAFHLVIKNMDPSSISEIAFSIGKTLGLALIIGIVVAIFLFMSFKRLQAPLKSSYLLLFFCLYILYR